MLEHSPCRDWKRKKAFDMLPNNCDNVGDNFFVGGTPFPYGQIVYHDLFYLISQLNVTLCSNNMQQKKLRKRKHNILKLSITAEGCSCRVSRYQSWLFYFWQCRIKPTNVQLVHLNKLSKTRDTVLTAILFRHKNFHSFKKV